MLFRLFYEILLFYLIYKVVKWVLSPNRPSVSGRKRPEVQDEDIEDAKYREIKD